MKPIPYYKKHLKPSYGLFILVFCFGVAVAATTFSISSAQLMSVGNGYVLNAKIDYQLTPRVKEALNNGVPIVFLQEFELQEVSTLWGGYWQWSTTVWQTELRYELRYHALTEQYVLQSIDTGQQRNFPSLYSALDVLGQVTGLSLPPIYTVTIDDLQLQLRSGLDLYALPTPMRPGALLSDKWDLTSPWVIAQWQ